MQLYEMGTWKFLQMVWALTVQGRPFPEGVSKERMEESQQSMNKLHSEHAPGQVQAHSYARRWRFCLDAAQNVNLLRATQSTKISVQLQIVSESEPQTLIQLALRHILAMSSCAHFCDLVESPRRKTHKPIAALGRILGPCIEPSTHAVACPNKCESEWTTHIPRVCVRGDCRPN